MIKTGAQAWVQSDACNQDMPGATHLVVIETPTELADIKTFVSNLVPGVVTGDSVWIGGVQLKTATAPDEGWVGFDGMPLFNGWGAGEPSDGADRDENNHQEQFVRMAQIQPAPFFIDDAGGNRFGGLCECDGKPLPANAAAAIDSYRP